MKRIILLTPLLLGTACLPISEWSRSVSRTFVGIRVVDRCVVSINRDSAPVRVTESSRRACVSRARVLEHEPPDVTHDVLRNGPAGPIPAGPDDRVHCRYMPAKLQGGSMKFYCLRTDSLNRPLDESGALVPGAVDFDDEGRLLDADGRRVRDEDGRSIDGHELHVKYFIGPEPDPRHREMFTETVVSRIFWALGVPADRVYMPASVHCFGCTAHPWVQEQIADTSATFRLASFKIAYDGKKISTERGDGFLGLGGRYDHGWSFRDVSRFTTRVEAEVHSLALNLVAYNNYHSIQNDLRCRDGAWDPDTGSCDDVVAYVSDVGGTLGGVDPVELPGGDRPVMPSHPRGDFITFSHGSVFEDPARCELRYGVGDVDQVTEEGRQAFVARAEGRLEYDNLLTIFKAARIHRMDPHANEYIRQREGLGSDADIDEVVQRAWADALHARLREIANVKCPDL